MAGGAPIVPVLLGGGTGTRLWPVSRASHPKQFVDLFGQETLFQSAARRVSHEMFAPPLVLVRAEHQFTASRQLSDVGINNATLLLEPGPRNTAPAILAAALHLERATPGALMLVMPSDHVIDSPEAFRDSISAARPAAKAGRLVTFGIQPTGPETGFGYLDPAAPLPKDGAAAVPLKRFVEKPSRERAKAMLEHGSCLWNAGIFLFTTDAILAAFQACAPDMVPQARQALETGQSVVGGIRLGAGAWSALPSISLDHAIMEHADNLSVVPLPGRWSDLGGWDAVFREAGPGENGVVTHGPVTALDCENTLIRSEEDGLQVVGIGLRNLITVATSDAVLVADAARAQDVRQAVSALKARQVRQAEQFPREDRPWGWFECIAAGDRFQVKRIHVDPGQALSLQSHRHRAEHWVVVSGTARVTINGEVRLVTQDQSVHVSSGTVHRLENPGKSPVVLIEVQTGSYLGEDDIIRYEDRYARNQEATPAREIPAIPGKIDNSGR